MENPNLNHPKDIDFGMRHCRGWLLQSESLLINFKELCYSLAQVVARTDQALNA
jgi:hypothetical protein